jgi:large subunit ribosomal protein L3
VIEAGPCRVVQLKTPERDGYSAVQLAFGDTKPQRLSKPELGHLKKADAPPQRHLAELRVDDLSGFEVGQVIGADVFGAGERVDVTGISKGKGFAGAMKRHNFKGQGASHGNHKKHRSPVRWVRVRRRRVCSRACAWPVSTATSESPPRTSRSWRATPSGGSCS